MEDKLKSNEIEQKKHGKYYVVKSSKQAQVLQWITGQRPYVFYDRDNKKEKNEIYSFLYDDDIKEALKILHDARKKLYKEHK